ncbi:hypothetical protein BFP77_14535 [Maribacter sp. 4U21]|uniref:hypothetical protein n=1 Tax=Maribacter sp. 4U21 TaxID=1889779 RepID=UPI000C1476E0|nr:hypothetical protein [Maribacter sp. 4U21]PIB26209.1 hypothetical protein BFP77_14535 [Maribacter sp. 4U21]
MEERFNKFEDIPLALEDNINMFVPNEAIVIYEGNFKLRISENTIPIQASGIIEIRWQPTIVCRFECTYEKSSSFRFLDFISAKDVELILNPQIAFKVYLVRSSSEDNFLRGEFVEMPFFGNSLEEVEYVSFSIPNLRGFLGSKIKRDNEHGVIFPRERIVFSNNRFEIILEMRFKYAEHVKALNNEGGHLLLYNGTIRKKTQSHKLNVEELNGQIRCLNFFLSFVNGRRICAMFFNGKLNDDSVWSSFKYNGTENFSTRHFRWAIPNIKLLDLQTLYTNFYDIWRSGSDKNFLIFAVKWYNEANMNEVSADTRLIMAQTTLELIYNWWIIEKHKLISIKDANNLKAENRIRLVLAQMGMSYDIPEEFQGLNRLRKKSTVEDGPHSIVYLRNSLVHSNTSKMNNINNLDKHVRAEVVMLANWYIELALLKILDYNGTYNRRMMGPKQVPWATKR